MRNPQRIHTLYLIIICMLMIFGVNEAIETLITQAKSKAANLNINSSLDSSVIQKLKNKQPVTIVAYGDSITWGYKRDRITGKVKQVKNPYPNVLEKELRIRFGYPNITVINKGHPGWTSIQAVENIDVEILPYQPDLVICMFGINDARGHDKYSPRGLPVSVDLYKENNRQLLQIIKDKGTEVVIISPTTITSRKNNGNITQVDYKNAIKSLAQEENVQYVNGSDIPIRGNLSDGIHFKQDKYALIAEKILIDVFGTYQLKSQGN